MVPRICAGLIYKGLGRSQLGNLSNDLSPQAEAERIKTKQRALWPACTDTNKYPAPPRSLNEGRDLKAYSDADYNLSKVYPLFRGCWRVWVP